MFKELAENYLNEEAQKYSVPHIEGKRDVQTDIPPEKRTLKNRPRYANGNVKVQFQDWLEMVPASSSRGTIAKGADNKWYGWSHRAIYGFGIGDTVPKDACGNNTGKSYTIKTDAQAKKAAENFSDSVS